MTVPLALQARRGPRLGAHFALTWAAAALAPRVDRKRRRRWAASLARRTLAILDVRVSRRGPAAPLRAPCLVVANHISWLDVYVLNAVCEARFVAKSEVRGWPLAGRIAAGFESLFIVRGSKRDAARVKDQIAAALSAGERVVVFPEGTTTDGTSLGPFHPALLQAAIDAGVPVQPVALRYPNLDGTPHPAPAFIDDMTFVGSLGRVLAVPALHAQLVFGIPIQTPGRTRRELAALTRAFIGRALGVRVDAALRPSTRRGLASRFPTGAAPRNARTSRADRAAANLLS